MSREETDFIFHRFNIGDRMIFEKYLEKIHSPWFSEKFNLSPGLQVKL